MSIVVLALTLLGLLISVGGKRGLKTGVVIMINLVLFLIAASLIFNGSDPVVTAFSISLVSSLFTLFLSSGFNKKTLAAFISVQLVVFFEYFLIHILCTSADCAGFSYEEMLELAGSSLNIGIDMMKLITASVIIALSGSAVDTAIAISTAVFEVDRNNPGLSAKNLFSSGMNVGRDILGTTTNTLFFAFVGEAAGLVIMFFVLEYDLSYIINSKILFKEAAQMLFCGLGCVAVIPVCSHLISSCLGGRLKTPSESFIGLIKDIYIKLKTTSLEKDA